MQKILVEIHVPKYCDECPFYKEVKYSYKIDIDAPEESGRTSSGQRVGYDTAREAKCAKNYYSQPMRGRSFVGRKYDGCRLVEDSISLTNKLNK